MVSRCTRSPDVTAARKRSRTRTLQLNVAADAVGIDHLAKQDGAPITQLGHEMTELVAGIGHRNRVGAVGKLFSRKDLNSLRAGEPIRVKPQMQRQRPVQLDQPR